jgi:hypothetical protein
MSKIFKHELAVGDLTKIDCMEVLSVIEQDGKIMLYTISDTELDYNLSNNQHLFFYVLGTGWDTDRVDNMKFLATVKVGSFVWHVFYRRKAV